MMPDVVQILEYFSIVPLGEAHRVHALVGLVLDGRGTLTAPSTPATPTPTSQATAPSTPAPPRKRRRRRTKAEMAAARAERQPSQIQPGAQAAPVEAEPAEDPSVGIALESFGDPEQPPF